MNDIDPIEAFEQECCERVASYAGQPIADAGTRVRA